MVGITEREANLIYEEIFALHTDKVNVYKDKANRLRTKFDTILKELVKRKYNCSENDVNRKYSGFESKILALFPEAGENGDERSNQLFSDLNKARGHFNGVQHANLGSSEITASEYKFCLRTVAKLVAWFSSAPIPPKLLDASLVLEKVKIERNMDIVIILELFDSLERINEGIEVFNNLRKMIKSKNKLGFENVNIHVLTYNPQIGIFSSVEKVGGVPASSSNEALERGLRLLDGPIDRAFLDDNAATPWFMWLSHKPIAKPEQKNIEKLSTLINEGFVSFYPINMGGKETAESFEKYWPECAPIKMDPAKSENFFNISIMLTIQRMLSKK